MAVVEEARVHKVLLGEEDEDEEEGVDDRDDDGEDGEGEGVEVVDADAVPWTAKAEARDVRMEETLQFLETGELLASDPKSQHQFIWTT